MSKPAIDEGNNIITSEYKRNIVDDEDIVRMRMRMRMRVRDEITSYELYIIWLWIVIHYSSNSK